MYRTSPTCMESSNSRILTNNDFALQAKMVAVETSIDVGNILWIFYDICQDLRGGPKRTYLGGTPPNTPPYSQWGTLIYEGTPQYPFPSSSSTLHMAQHPPHGPKPWFNLPINHGGVISGMPPRCICFVLSLKCWHRCLLRLPSSNVKGVLRYLVFIDIFMPYIVDILVVLTDSHIWPDWWEADPHCYWAVSCAWWQGASRAPSLLDHPGRPGCATPDTIQAWWMQIHTHQIWPYCESTDIF